MQYNFSDLKKKSVINVIDGKDLGKMTDIIISYPECRAISFIVPGKKNGFLKSCQLIIGFHCIERIGDDTILVRLTAKPKHIEECGEDDQSYD